MIINYTKCHIIHFRMHTLTVALPIQYIVYTIFILYHPTVMQVKSGMWKTNLIDIWQSILVEISLQFRVYTLQWSCHNWIILSSLEMVLINQKVRRKRGLKRFGYTGNVTMVIHMRKADRVAKQLIAITVISCTIYLTLCSCLCQMGRSSHSKVMCRLRPCMLCCLYMGVLYAWQTWKMQ